MEQNGQPNFIMVLIKTVVWCIPYSLVLLGVGYMGFDVRGKFGIILGGFHDFGSYGQVGTVGSTQ